MRFARCDRARCGALFPVATPHSLVRLFDDVGEHVGINGEQLERELCPACRAELDQWFDEAPAAAAPWADPAVAGVEHVGPWEFETVAMPADPGEPIGHFGGIPVYADPSEPAEALQAALTPDTPGPAPVPVPQPVPAAGSGHKHETKRRCVACGHEGYRRFKRLPRGWLCWKCDGDTPRPDPGPPEGFRRAESARQAPPSVATSPVTAKCQDCPRSFILTGVVLKHAVELHELKHSHVVDVFGDDDADESASA